MNIFAQNKKLIIIITSITVSLIVLLFVLVSLLPKETVSNNIQNSETVDNTISENIENNISENLENTLATKEILIQDFYLDKNKIILNLQDKKEHNIKATIKPEDVTNQNIYWLSYNDSIATVDATGKVTAISEGETVIVASCGKLNAQCIVQVITSENTTKSDEEIVEEEIVEEEITDEDIIIDGTDSTTSSKPNTSTNKPTTNNNSTTQNNSYFDINKTNMSLSLVNKKTDKITIKTNINKPVYFVSTNKNVATVDNKGTVTAVSVGTAKIIASCSNQTATCTVTVSKVAVTTNASSNSVISLNTSNLSLSTNKNKKYSLKATVSPANATINWSSSNPNVATVNNKGTVTAKRKWNSNNYC